MEIAMATNTGKGFRKGEVRTRSQVENPRTGDWVKRDDRSGRFMDVKRDGDPFKGVRREK
jgi:hypothetical protein